MQDAWLYELSRVLKQDGVLIITVHGDNAAKLLNDDAATILQRDGFLHTHSSKLKGFVPDWYNTTWHSQTYIVQRLERQFQTVTYRKIPDGMQDLVIAQSKRA